MTPADAAFILALVNDADFLRHIGDRGVRSQDDARRYIETGPLASYDRYGFGLWLVEVRADPPPIGICGPPKRDTPARRANLTHGDAAPSHYTRRAAGPPRR